MAFTRKNLMSHEFTIDSTTPPPTVDISEVVEFGRNV